MRNFQFNRRSMFFLTAPALAIALLPAVAMADGQQVYIGALGQVTERGATRDGVCNQLARDYDAGQTCSDGTRPSYRGVSEPVIEDSSHYHCYVQATNCSDIGRGDWVTVAFTFTSLICSDPAQLWSADTGTCVGFYDSTANKPDGGSCPVANPQFGKPIFPLTGVEREAVPLGFSIGRQPVSLTYDTQIVLPEVAGNSTWLVPAPPSFGLLWQSSLHKRIALQSSTGVPGAANSAVALLRGSNIQQTARVASLSLCTDVTGSQACYVSTTDPLLRVAYVGSGAILIDAGNGSEESYAPDGSLTSVRSVDGGRLDYHYTDSSYPAGAGLLYSVTDEFNRAVGFVYENPGNPRINSIVQPDGVAIGVAYDGVNNLSNLNWVDLTNRQFLYENVPSVWEMTGIQDERGLRYATIGYDTVGRAVHSELAGGVEAYTTTYPNNVFPNWSVVEIFHPDVQMIERQHTWAPATQPTVSFPNGQTSSFTGSAVNGMAAMNSQTQAAGSGCSASMSAQAYDTAGNVLSRDDFNGTRTCYMYDLARNLRTMTLDGMPSSKACPTDPALFKPAPVDSTHPERLTTTAWHPAWRLKVREAEPKKLTTWVYNGQPDPIDSGRPITCVAGAPTLPDGKPLAVVCRRYEQSTDDDSGAANLSPAHILGTRLWSYTYDQSGQMLTVTAPGTVASNTTTFAYYPATSFPDGVKGHTMGDLQTITNAASQTTQYTSYDKAGRLLSSLDPNGAVTTLTYWPRGWLQTQTVTSATGTALSTGFAYWPNGLLQTVTLPGGMTLNYVYDAAQRLSDVTDSAGNTVHYTLDNEGRRTGELFKDPSGKLAGSIARVYDALNRLQTVTGTTH